MQVTTGQRPTLTRQPVQRDKQQEKQKVGYIICCTPIAIFIR
jgi:hypothetical protein